jgi:hypothetical protein
MSFDAASHQYQKYLKNGPWTLCLGAGICYDILPTWFDLTREVVNRTFGKSISAEEFKIIFEKSGFTLDGWIQSSYNYHKKTGNDDESFNEILENALYNSLIIKADNYGLKDPLLKLFYNPKRLKKEEVLKCCDFFESEFKNSSLLQLVEVLLDKDLNKPSAIIIFNADTLLSALIQLFSIRNHYLETNEYDFPPEEYKKVIYQFETFGKKIPIFHIHGTIFPPFSNINKKLDSRHNLIFLESSYADVANTMYSWAQSTFLYYSSNSRMVFTGLSMSDTNIRRWLNWSTSSRNTEINIIHHKEKKLITTQNNIWLRTKPSSSLECQTLEDSLLHLGTKIGWIENWEQIGIALKNLMKL